MAKNYVSNKDETVRMFENDFMEFFSRVHYTVPLYVYVPVILILMYLSIFVYKISALNIFVLLVGGVLAWYRNRRRKRPDSAPPGRRRVHKRDRLRPAVPYRQ